jgi:hypothetical protein
MLYRLTLKGQPFHKAVPSHAERMMLLKWRMQFWMRTDDWQAYTLELAPVKRSF